MEKNILKKALLMCEKNVDFDNIDNWQNADFDVICLIRGVKVRLPFDVGKDLNPYGIFPFANENWFLELYETKGECSRTLAEELKLPSLSEYAKLYNIRKEF